MPRVRSPRRPQTRADFAALAARLRPKDWTRAGFRARAAHIALGLLQRGVPVAVLDAWWPGGDENGDERGVGPYARTWAHYGHLAKATAPHAPRDDAAVQRAIVDGITEAPATATCTDGVTRAVYPKSLAVHFALTALDERLADPTLSALDWLTVVQCWVWLVTTPGPGAPCDVHAFAQPIAQWPRPDLTGADAWLATLTEVDLLALVQAYNAVDRAAVSVLLAAFPRQSGAPSRLSLAGFFGSVAKERDVSRVSAKQILATTLSDAIAHEEARARAESEAAAKAPAHHGSTTGRVR